MHNPITITLTQHQADNAKAYADKWEVEDDAEGRIRHVKLFSRCLAAQALAVCFHAAGTYYQIGDDEKLVCRSLAKEGNYVQIDCLATAKDRPQHFISGSVLLSDKAADVFVNAKIITHQCVLLEGWATRGEWKKATDYPNGCKVMRPEESKPMYNLLRFLKHRVAGSGALKPHKSALDTPTGAKVPENNTGAPRRAIVEPVIEPIVTDADIPWALGEKERA